MGLLDYWAIKKYGKIQLLHYIAIAENNYIRRH